MKIRYLELFWRKFNFALYFNKNRLSQVGHVLKRHCDVIHWPIFKMIFLKVHVGMVICGFWKLTAIKLCHFWSKYDIFKSACWNGYLWLLKADLNVHNLAKAVPLGYAKKVAAPHTEVLRSISKESKATAVARNLQYM